MFRIILKFRIAIIAAVGAATVFFALQIPKLELDPDTEVYVPKEHPMRERWTEAKDLFGIGRDILIAVVADEPDGIFTPEILGGIMKLTDDIKSLDYVFADDVKSLSDAEAIHGTEEGLDVERFYEEPPTTVQEVAAIRRSVFENTVYLDRLVSHDGTIAAIIVKTHQDYGVHPVEIAKRLDAYLQGVDIPGTEILIAGNPVIEAVYGRQMATDLSQLIPIALMVVAVILFVCFRTLSLPRLAARAVIFGVAIAAWTLWRSQPGGEQASLSPPAVAALAVVLAMLTVRGVLLPALVVVAAVVWTWGLQAFLGVPVYIAGTLVPPLLLAIGCAYGIHIVERYYDKAGSGGTPEEVVLATMSELWRPVVLTALTTAAGFGSLAAGTMTVFQIFGLTTAFGILVATLISLTVLPCILSLLPLPRPESGGERTSFLPNLLMNAGWAIEKNRRAIAITGTVIVVLFLVSATGLRVDYSWVESLQPGTPVLRADRVLRERHGGTTPFSIIVRANEVDGIKEPAVLRAIDKVLAELSKNPLVGDTRSIAEYVKRMNQSMNEDRPEAYTVPESREMVAQYLLLYSMSGNPSEFDDVVDYEYSAANLSILLRSDQMAAMGGVIAQAEKLLDEHLRPLGVTATLTGSATILKTIIELSVESQIYSLATACTLVFVFMAILFRSIRDALICMIPVFFTGVANFGGMALLDIPLDPGSAMISAIALGIGIDYAIHLMSRFRDLVDEQGMAVNDAMIETMRTTGRAVLFNGTVVVAGFLVLGFSTAPNNATFGRTIASNMAISCLAALIFMPAALTTLGHLISRRTATIAQDGACQIPEDVVAEPDMSDEAYAGVTTVTASQE